MVRVVMNEVDAPSWLIPGLWDCKRAAALLKAGGDPMGAWEEWSRDKYPDVESAIGAKDDDVDDRSIVGLDMCLVARVATAVAGVVKGLGLKSHAQSKWVVAGVSNPVRIHAGDGVVFAMIMPMRL